MKKQFFIANWKSHKVPSEVEDWFVNFARSTGVKNDDHEIIVCAPFPLLSFCQEYASKHTPFVQMGSQDISQFPEGAYTGEVAGKLVKSLATHVIIGHSERRNYFHEDEKVLAEKVLAAQANMLTPVYCISKVSDPIPLGVEIVAYEPLDAIGTGKPADPQVVEDIARTVKEKNGVSYILYGGSVAPPNVSTYTRLPSIDGVLVGGASLDPQEFAQLITHA